MTSHSNKKRKLSRTSTEKHIEGIKKKYKKSPSSQKPGPVLLIPSGSTMLDLACSDSCKGAYRPGRIVNLIGDSSAGKSFLALTMLATICYDKRFDNYDLYYDDAEQTNEFDLEYLFNKKDVKFTDRLILKNSVYAEETGDEIHEACKKALKKDGKPFIYITDSWDVLRSKYEEAKEKVNIGKRKRDQKEEGSYGDGKAKMLHKFCRLNVGKIKQTNSLWVIVSQTKDNFGPDAMFNPKIVTGGNAIKFFPSHRVWLTIIQRFYKTEREIGIASKIKVVKNKFSGKRRNIITPLFYDYGVDDIGSIINFLNSKYGKEHWKTRTRTVDGKSTTAIDAKELGVFLKEKALVKYIEDNSLEDDLKQIAETVWNDIEESLKLGRKPKFI